MLHRSRGVVAVFAGVLAALLLVGILQAQGGTGYYRTTGPGQVVTGTVNATPRSYWAGALIVNIGGQDAGAYCIDAEHAIQVSETLAVEGPTNCQIAWLVRHYPPLIESSLYPDNPPTPPAADWRVEMAARQSALWRFTDGFVLTGGTDEAVRHRAQDIIKSVPGVCTDVLPVPALRLTPGDVTSGYPAQATRVFTASATQGGAPLSGLPITVSLSPAGGFVLSGEHLVTGPDGTATFSVTARAPGTTQISARAIFSLPAGVTLGPLDGNGQRMALGEAVSGPLFADATAIWTPGHSIVAQVFSDRNMNGLRDDDEKGLAGWALDLYAAGRGLLESGITVAPGGSILFDGDGDAGLPAGSYRVQVTEQVGYLLTTPGAVTVTLSPGDDGQVQFGVLPLPAVRACAYLDANENHLRDAGEPGLADWMMQLYDGGDQSAVISAYGTTAADGCVVLGFYDTSYYEPGVPYYVLQGPQDGWYTTGTPSQTFELLPTEVQFVDFGNVHPAPGVGLEVAGPAYAHAGDLLTYTLTARNTGNVMLGGAVTDPGLLGLDCRFEALAPGDEAVCQAHLPVPDAGIPDPLLGSASVQAYDGYDHNVAQARQRTLDILHPAIELVATATPAALEAGEPVTWEVSVYNRGDTPLYGVTLLDDAGRSFGPLKLAAGDGDDAGGDDQATWRTITYPGASTANRFSGRGADVLGAVVTDTAQAQVTVLPIPDADGDGIPDRVEGADILAGPVDTDSDGTPDYLDLDSDADGIPDAVEAGAAPHYPVDSDSDGTPDFRDQDSDGDGVPDAVEAGAVPATPADSNGDGVPDYLDRDSDGDGIPDAGEWSSGDTDWLSGCSVRLPVCFDNDADGDGVHNYADLDSDADLLGDAVEGLKDSDEDGIPDWLDAVANPCGELQRILLPLVLRF